MEKKRKKHTFLIITACFLALAVIQTLPIFFYAPLGSKTMVGSNIILSYQPGDEKGANEVFSLLTKKSDEIYTKMNFTSTIPTKVYLYKTRSQLAIREAGFITLAIAPLWHIGDSHNGNIMMVSPYAPVKVHTHDDILNATLHELVHSIVFQINPKLSYFWDNGLATYLAQQKFNIDISTMAVPTIKQMHTENGLEFGEIGGYAFSYNYIDYLEKKYGWDKIVTYASGNGSYEDVFGKSEKEIYDEWCQYLNGRDN